MRPSTRFAVLALLAGCGTTLPSTVPLGRGPLAGPASEDVPVAIEAKRNDPHDKFEVASGSDAGVADASAAKGKKVAAKDAGVDAGADSSAASASDAGATGAFAGDYSGKDVTEYKLADAPGGGPPKQEDPKAHITVVAADDGSLAFKLIASNDGSTICTLSAPKAAGNVATISAGQHCFDRATGPMQATVRAGTATFAGKHLLFVLGMDLVIDAPGMQMHGTMDYHFDGSRS